MSIRSKEQRMRLTVNEVKIKVIETQIFKSNLDSLLYGFFTVMTIPKFANNYEELISIIIFISYCFNYQITLHA